LKEFPTCEVVFPISGENIYLQSVLRMGVWENLQKILLVS